MLRAEVERLRAAVAEAIAEEQRACAKVCDDIANSDVTRTMEEERGADYCAEAIRERMAPGETR